MLKHHRPTIQKDEVAWVQHNWRPGFAILPHRTISGHWCWLKLIYKRVVWRYTGFIDEPFNEYGDLMDILKNNE